MKTQTYFVTIITVFAFIVFAHNVFAQDSVQTVEKLIPETRVENADESFDTGSTVETTNTSTTDTSTAGERDSSTDIVPTATISSDLKDKFNELNSQVVPKQTETFLQPVAPEIERKAQEEIIEAQGESLDDRGELDAQRDTDEDGISDYDEIHLYNTDPDSKSTFGDEESDAEKIIRGVNPLTNEPISYEDPRETEKFKEVYFVEEVKFVQTETGNRAILFKGSAPKNSFVTIYIFSTPIIVTVKSDSEGAWEYTYDRELENGDHQVHVATVNNSGRIVAQGAGASFVKSAEAVELARDNVPVSEGAGSAVPRGWLISGFIVAVLLLIVAVIFIIGFFSKDDQLDEPENNI